MKETNKVDDKFDKVERIWDRLQKLILKVVGGVVGISLAVFIAYGQLKDTHEEHFEQEKIEHAQCLEEHEAHNDSIVAVGLPAYTCTKKVWIIDPRGHREGDTVYVDYYSDGYVERYYPDGESYYPD